VECNVQRYYSVFGLKLASDRDLPLVTVDGGPVDIEVTEDEIARAARSPQVLHEVAEPIRLRISQVDGLMDFRYGDCHVVWDPAASRVTYAGAGDELLLADALTRVALPIVALIGHERRIALHGSVVEHRNRAWIFAGPSGAGKSTAVRGMLIRGAHLLSDDFALLDLERMEVLPGPADIRLWAKATSVAEAARDISVTERGKQRLRLPDSSMRAVSVPVGGIIHMSDQPHAMSTEVVSIGGGRALRLLLANTFTFTATSPEERVLRFRNAAWLAKVTASFVCSYFKRAEKLDEHLMSIWHFIAGSGNGS